MFDEADLQPISALQHLAFCERQWALIYLEGIWAENRLTVEGRHLHDRAHQEETESRGDLRIARGLRLRSLQLGLTGVADVVEFHRCGELAAGRDGPPNEGTGGVHLHGVKGLWRPLPVEYKRGRPKLGSYDEVQLCAQALCLEEMLGVPISAGALFYGQPHQRHEVPFTVALREQTTRLAARLHELAQSGRTPFARYEKKCDSCSLLPQCLPKTLRKSRDVAKYLSEAADPPEREDEGA